MSSIIPESALSQHIAVIGKAGSGKSYTMRGLVESMLEAGERVCIVDPTGAWYGLRTLANGKTAGFPVVIFGGSHGDFPLQQHHGEELAEIIGTSNTPAIIDTSALRTGERTKLFTDLAEALLRKNKGPLHLVIDEAHLFAPQGRVHDPQSGAMLHAANNLVSLGRVRGLRVTLISQRPAKVHKDSLTQVETLIAMRLIAPQDRKAVEEWIKDNADAAQGKEVLSSLATLKTGHGWVWAPEQGILKRVQFPKIKTFDTGRTPDGTEPEAKVLATIDKSLIAQRLKTVAQEAEANDPAKLKQRIRELEREAAKPVAHTIDQHLIDKVREEMYAIGYKEGFQSGARETFNVAKESVVAGHAQAMRIFEERGNVPVPATPAVKQSIPMPLVSNRNGITKAKQSHNYGNQITGPEQRILDAVAWLEQSTGKPSHEMPAVAFLAGYTIGGGAFNNPRGSLRTKGLITVNSNMVELTDAGRNVANYPDRALNNDELHRSVMERLPGPEQKLLAELLKQYPGSLSNNDLAERTGYSPGGGAFNNPRGRLRTLGLIEYQSGMSKASDCLFPV